jgi:hypothetical protein
MLYRAGHFPLRSENSSECQSAVPGMWQHDTMRSLLGPSRNDPHAAMAPSVSKYSTHNAKVRNGTVMVRTDGK